MSTEPLALISALTEELARLLAAEQKASDRKAAQIVNLRERHASALHRIEELLHERAFLRWKLEAERQRRCAAQSAPTVALMRQALTEDTPPAGPSTPDAPAPSDSISPTTSDQNPQGGNRLESETDSLGTETPHTSRNTWRPRYREEVLRRARLDALSITHPTERADTANDDT